MKSLIFYDIGMSAGNWIPVKLCSLTLRANSIPTSLEVNFQGTLPVNIINVIIPKDQISHFSVYRHFYPL